MFDFISNLNPIELLLFLFVTMLFLHIIADFLVQNNFMATYKQKKNWNIKDGKYENDYKIVLLVHSFSWSFITFFPLLIYTKNIRYWICVLIMNTFFHALIDDSKCNDLTIDLVLDQLLHIIQIAISVITSYFITL